MGNRSISFRTSVLPNDNQGNADQQAQYQQREIAFCGGGDRDNIVQAHDDVGEKYRANRRKERTI